MVSLKKRSGRGLDSADASQNSLMDFYEHNNKPSTSQKARNLLNRVEI